MQLRAITDCPQGQQPGEIFEPDTDAMGEVLISVGAAERVEADDDTAGVKAKPKPKGKGTYNRRDLVAEDR